MMTDLFFVSLQVVFLGLFGFTCYHLGHSKGTEAGYDKGFSNGLSVYPNLEKVVVEKIQQKMKEEKGR